MDKNPLPPLLLSALLPLSAAWGADPWSESQDPAVPAYVEMSLEQLLELNVVTSPSTYAQNPLEAHANITLISREQIRRRGYQNLVDVLEDLPGFEFATFGDGGGEYPSHSMNRGIGGDPGNTKLLVMVDGVVQNHIAFNWSAGWTDEQMLHDLERIEVIQGPGSALYGASAFSGVVNLVTLREFEDFEGRAGIGPDNTQDLQLLSGKRLGDWHLQFALRRHQSDGDGGLGRPDPAGYFHANTAPAMLSEDFGPNGGYLANTPNPYAGAPIPDGFDTSKDDLSMRLKLTGEDLEFGAFYWERRDGLGSYTSGFEYYANDPDRPFLAHQSGLHVYARRRTDLDPNLNLDSTLTYRQSVQEPDTGFSYTYRFPDLTKSYHSQSEQLSLEQRLNYASDEHNRWIGGYRVQRSWKMDQAVSLGAVQSDADQTASTACWDLRLLGPAQPCATPREAVDEAAAYLLWDGSLAEDWSHSVGLRYDRSDEFGSIFNPRLGLIRRFSDRWLVKALYGTAFRQPGIFELQDEFRGNPDLSPERIHTFELESDFQISPNSQFKANLFRSEISDLIDVVADQNREGGERFDNLHGSTRIWGLSLAVEWRLSPRLDLFSNYSLTESEDANAWGARHKVNLGTNWKTWNDRLNLNLRANLVGPRQTPASNALFHGDEAPGYGKLDLTVTLKRLLGVRGLEAQLVADNLLDQDYYGLGRQSGSNDIALYDPATAPNPPGFIPPYHPQPGRQLLLSLAYRFD